MNHIEKEKLIKADIASIENRVRHAFNQGYDLGYKEGKANCSEIPTGSTTKNDLGVDAVSRQTVIDLMMQKWGENFSGDDAMQESIDAIREMPSVTQPLSSGLEKNSKKLENPTSKNDSEVDCVSRQFMYDLGATCIAYRNDKQELIPIISIDELPSVTPQEPRWIPVSEKLPNDRNWYLGIFKESDTGWINPLPFICDYVGRETKATTKEHWILRGFTDMDEHIDYYFNLECVAWMPLPKAYREVEE